MSEGIGWPNNESPESYNVHANVKLTQEQKDKIAESGESESQWIREAIEMRLEREMTDNERQERLRGKLHAKVASLAGEGPTEEDKRLVLRNRLNERMQEIILEKDNV